MADPLARPVSGQGHGHSGAGPSGPTGSTAQAAPPPTAPSPAAPTRARSPGRTLVVIGAGWAGLAAAVAATQRGWQVRLLEMAGHPGGRARSTVARGALWDNGQHILIGAYRQTLALMRQVGVEPAQALQRRPLALARPDGSGLQLGPGPTPLAFATAVLRCADWGWAERLRLLAACGRWLGSGFRCEPGLSVAQWAEGLPATVRSSLIEPLSVAALNTPAQEASAAVLLRVLQDALFSGPGSADLLLPQQPLSQLLPEPALRWLCRHGADWQPGRRVQRLAADGPRWWVDDEPADAVVLACSAPEAARLVQPIDAGWAARASALRHQAIVTAWLHDAQLRLPQPMLALREGPQAPAQFVFALGDLGGPAGLFSFVVSGAAGWLQAGLPAVGEAVLGQARAAFGSRHFSQAGTLRHLAAEKRATFACTPGLQRPPTRIAPGLVAAGDHVAGPYPATLEGAVRSGRAAIEALPPRT